MRKRGLSIGVAVASVGSLLLAATAVPAYGLDAAADAVEKVGPTDPGSLVNDPAAERADYDDNQNSVRVAAAGPDLIASFRESPTGWVGYSRSTDGGRTWRDQGVVSSGELKFKGIGDVAADRGRGVFYLAATAWTRRDPNEGAYVFRAATSGGPLASPVLAIDDADSLSLAVDDFPGEGESTVYLTYGDAGIYLVRSVDGGETWGPSPGTLVVGDPDGSGPIVVTPDHCVHSFYLAGSAIAVRTSCDGGVTFAPEVKVADTSGDDLHVRGGIYTNSLPHVAANPVTGALYVVYNATVAPDRRPDILLTTSTDGGATWSTPTAVNADAGDVEQFSPAVAVSDDATRLLITYYDRRRDKRVGADTQRWGRNGQIDPTTGTLRLLNEFQLGPSFSPVSDGDFGGDRDNWSIHEAVAFSDGAFVPAWTDNRDRDDCQPIGGLSCEFRSDIRSARAPVSGRTDLSTTVTAPDDVVALGGEYTYTATVTNDSTINPAHNVWVRSELPLAARHVATTTDGPGECWRWKRDVSCQLGTLQPGQALSMTITAQALASGPLKRKAVATTSSPDLTAGNNGATADGTVAEAATTTTVFSTGDIAVEIPRGGFVAVPLEIAPAPGIALDVDVMLRVYARNTASISMTLVSPSGRQVHLSSDNGRNYPGDYGSGPISCAGTPAVFDDAATWSVHDGGVPFTKEPINPEGPLSDAAGVGYSGTWRLVVGGLAGTVGCGSLQIEHTTD